MSIERLLTVPTSQEATSIQNRLENAGIESFVTNENFSNLMPIYYGMLGSGIQIMIEDSFEVTAKEVLPDYFSIPDEPVQCPKCHSKKIGYGFGKSKIRKSFIVLFSLLVANPFGNIQTSRHCKECVQEF